MTKWKYLVEWISMPGDFTEEGEWERDHQRRLDDRGAQGWELINIMAHSAIFKRPAQPEPPALLVVNNVNGMEFQQLADSIKAELDRYWEEKEVRRDPGA
jgi:hypothetical protein